MSFTSLSIKKLIFILAILTSFFFILQYTASAEILGDCKDACKYQGGDKNLYYCRITDTVFDSKKEIFPSIPYSCENQCIKPNGDCYFGWNFWMCLDKDSVNFKYPENNYNPTCFADFDFYKPLNLANVQDLDSKIIEMSNNLPTFGKFSVLTNFDKCFAINYCPNQIILLKEFSSKTLSILSKTDFQGKCDNQVMNMLSYSLNGYVGLNEAEHPFGTEFYCPGQELCGLKGTGSCDISNNGGPLMLNLNGMGLPLDQFKDENIRESVVISYDDPNSMMKLTSTSAVPDQNIIINCGDKGVGVSFWAQNAMFECNSLNGPHAIITPGATIEYDGYSIRNNGNDAVNIYWGGGNKEGIVIDETDGIKFYFNNVKGLIITKGCAKITVNDEGST